jgi:hypothetical protein
MDRSGCPTYIWFLALLYVIFCLNHCVDPNLADGTKSPLQVVTFLMTDISRSSTNKKKRHERVPKLRDLHPKDPTKVPHCYTKRSNCTVKSGQILTTSDDDTNDVADSLPPEDADNADDIDIIDPPTGPTAPSAELQQQFLKTRDTHIAEQPDSFVYLRDNGENENCIWKEFEVTF